MQSAVETGAMAEFFAGIRSAKTGRKYQRLAREFFDFLKLRGDFGEQCEVFARKAKRAEISGRRSISPT